MLNYKAVSLENEYLTIIKPVARSLIVKPGENVKAHVVDIPPELYEVVAKILAFIYTKSKKF